MTGNPPSEAPPQTPIRTKSRVNSRRQRRRWLPYAGGVLLLGLIVWGLWSDAAPVEVAKASRGMLRVTVNEEGKTRIKQRYLVSAPVTGQLRRIPFKAGAEVEAGVTVIAVIDPVAPGLLDTRTLFLAQARRDVAAANVERARAAHRFAANELRRMEQLAAERMISAQELENAQLRETSATKELAAAESSLREAEAELAEYNNTPADPGRLPVEVKAPATGRVLRVFEESSRVIGMGAPLVEIGNPADLEVVVEVLSRDAALMEPGMVVFLDQWGGPEPLEARVRLVEPGAFTKVSALGVEEQRVNVVADLVTPFEQRRNVGDAFRVEARIVMAEINDTLKVPSGAVFRQGNRPAVFVVQQGRARLALIGIGRSSGTEIQVQDGLQEGDEVIVYPGDRIRDGQRVRPLKVSG